MKSMLVVAVLLVGSIAHAESTRYVEGGAMIGAGAPGMVDLVGSVSGGAQLAAVPLWIHGQLEGGATADDQGGGGIEQLRAGVETRTCSRGFALCGVFGFDVGGLHGTWTSHDGSEHEDVRAVVGVPRVGLEAGGKHVVATATIELAEMLTGTHDYTYRGPSPGMTTTADGLGAFELGLGLGYRW
jgi:hypothetical protein